jgi:alpha-tubulin suppressor-like RCC1 family protein
VAAGERHTVAIEPAGSLWALGRNYHGQLGLGDLVDRHAPTPVDI